MHESLFPGDDHEIPTPDDLNVTKLGDSGVIITDTCNTAQKINRGLCKEVAEAAMKQMNANLAAGGEQQSITPIPRTLVIQADCHHHLRNVWIGAMNKRLSIYLNRLLATDLAKIDCKYMVTAKMDAVLRVIDKEFSLPANYPKGHGNYFKHWFQNNYPGELLVAVERTK